MRKNTEKRASKQTDKHQQDLKSEQNQERTLHFQTLSEVVRWFITAQLKGLPRLCALDRVMTKISTCPSFHLWCLPDDQQAGVQLELVDAAFKLPFTLK